ncbi:peptide ABC transporter ATP-binding protein [Aliiroseovarius zhejiangensis]|uniref:Peptide ABC transporter ATP-binding protein n=1 Tax=Aliiroseovarius zhejiangensis TaxID=1632025 RepID=A0ABQ3IPT6_9RHOB|nr:amino acid ABC transporter ATP-binding protein [Aliiroseovarius zhejiangensis]GHE90722.1 peptide ABC transporter ATP-binding protein [Aliiroseovarius zhejiangensis]
MSVLRLSNVTKSFGATQVLRGIDLEVNEGEMICLIGASGSGKSTLLRTINLLEPIDEGEIWFDGQDISLPDVAPQPIRRKIGLVFQSFNLFPHMTAVENVLLAPSRVFKRSKKDLLPEVMQLFEQFNLKDRMQAYPDQLSGGQQQRVAIVRALAMRPRIMLFDEVTSALDPELVSEVLDTLLKLKAQNMTMILATHEMGFAREAADRVCVLDGGKIIETGTPDQIFNAPQTKRAQAFLASVL